MKMLLSLFFAVVAWPATTTVSQMIVGPDGQPAAGQALIRISQPCQSGTTHVGDRTIPVKFTATVPAGQTNNFSVALVPNDAGGCAGTNYTFSWLLAGGSSRTDTVVVPTSSTPVSYDSVVVPPSTAAPPFWMIQWQQLAQNGAVPGNSPIWTGTSWVPGAPTALTESANATQIQGNAVSATAPSDGQTWRWNASASQWQLLTFVDQETVAGTIDGTNTTFMLAHAPNPGGGLVLFRNGLAQMSGQDYTLSGTTISFVTAATPQLGDTLLAWYRY
jgi:hypothetical protein